VLAAEGNAYDSARVVRHMKDTGTVEARLRLVAGRHNALLKELRRAFARGELTREGCCAIEGVRIIEEAIRSGLRFRAVFFSKGAQGKGTRLLPQIGAHVETLLLEDELFAGAVPSETPQGVAALVHCKQFSLDDILARAQAGPVLAIAGIQDPGNLGTIVRSAEAFGAAGVILGEGTVSPFNPKVVRASAGSLFRMAVVQAALKATIPALRQRGLRLVATSSHKGTALYETNLSRPLALFIGSEGAGLPRDLAGEMDEFITIPHAPRVESLNAGVAASIVLYEAARKRS
jgi:RNA methyltransferase, TrmH family